MRCACIDIGSNTTRLLVARIDGGRLTEVHQERVMTRIGRDLDISGSVSDAKTAEVAAAVRAQLAAARASGAEDVRVVATQAIRGAANRDTFITALATKAGAEVEILTGEEEARLAFLGATRTFPEPLDGVVAVVDVGGGSTEVAVGTAAVEWSASVRTGSGALADAHLREDPPAAAELAAVRRAAAAALGALRPPPADVAVAVGGSAASLRALVGHELCPETLERALAELSAAPAHDVAFRRGLDPERVRLLPAGILVLDAASALLGLPLQIGCGGLREGVCLEMAGFTG